MNIRTIKMMMTIKIRHLNKTLINCLKKKMLLIFTNKEVHRRKKYIRERKLSKKLVKKQKQKEN